jgi:NAD(P)-dependent dehydrogenase (short-subunit alcohol dehydrogenase family)
MTGTVLVTGAGRGVGRATVRRFLDDGWRVAAGVRDVERAREDLGAHDRLRVVHLDVTDAASVAAAADAAHEMAGGPLDCLVNNAGYAVMGASEDVDLDEARTMFETNLFGAVAVTQRVLPGMRERGRGVVVCMSSIGARLSNPLLSMYHASKYGMSAWAEAMRVELLPFGVRVHVVEPGMVDTDFPKATRPTGAVSRGEGPYAPLLTELRAGFRRWREEHPTGPEVVADVVARAVADPAAPFRLPVGADAEAMSAARDRLRDEEFHAWLMDFLGVRWS